MNKVLSILCHTAVFAAGFAAGYFLRKHSEVKFVEVTEEELEKEAYKDAQKAQEGTSTVDVREEISKVFDSGKTASEEPEEGIGNGQKIAYFKRWKAEEAAKKYDTRTTEEPNDIVTEVEENFDPEFMKSLEEDIQDNAGKEEIEAGSIEDWNYWLGIRDGKYNCVEIRWYETDNMICDDQDEEMERPEQFIGYDIRKRFEQIGEETTGDPDVRILINNRYNTIYHVTRIFGSLNKKKKQEEFGGDEEDDEEDDIYDRFATLRE